MNNFQKLGRAIGYIILVTAFLFVLYLYVAVAITAYYGLMSEDPIHNLLAAIVVVILINGFTNVYKRNN